MEFAQELLDESTSEVEVSEDEEIGIDELIGSLIDIDEGSDTEFHISPAEMLDESELQFDTLQQHPLYAGAPLSVAASWQSIMAYALANHLSYTAIDQLLGLLKLHVPSSSGLPKSLNRLKSHFNIDEPLPQQRFCSQCFGNVSSKEKCCSEQTCRANKAELCYFVPVPISTHLKEMVAGTVNIQVIIMHTACIAIT